ncbi:Low molecular weight phosphotyrosine protein phosphatase [Taxawa tesnikishii (nom. ined.)]|nr:Low molecular weight phosphotyrosine protein phosphatase [Dothideales sp. JES 119]
MAPPPAPSRNRPISVLFVCLDSCGTGAYHVGDAPDPRTLSVLSDHGIRPSFYTHEARKFRQSDFKDFDYIFAMDEENKEYLEHLRKRVVAKGELSEEQAGKVMLFGVWGGGEKRRWEIRITVVGMGSKLRMSRWKDFQRGF